MDVNSLRRRLGKSKSSQLAPPSELLNKREFIAPARTIFGFDGSTAMLVAVPPNGPASFQSPEISPAKATEATDTTAIAISRWHFEILIILATFCFGWQNLHFTQ